MHLGDWKCEVWNGFQKLGGGQPEEEATIRVVELGVQYSSHLSNKRERSLEVESGNVPRCIIYKKILSYKIILEIAYWSNDIFCRLGDRQRFTCDITTNPPTEHKVINTLLETFPGKMIWNIGNKRLQSSNDNEKVIIVCNAIMVALYNWELITIN